jgi:hypothetical protein
MYDDDTQIRKYVPTQVGCLLLFFVFGPLSRLRAAQDTGVERQLASELPKAAAKPFIAWLDHNAHSEGDALIGHEYRTPAAGTLSTIGAAYAVLGLTGFDPLRWSSDAAHTATLRRRL